MSRRWMLLALTSLATANVVQAAPQLRPQRDPKHVLVKFINRPSASAWSSAIHRYRMAAKAEVPAMGLQKLEIPDGVTPEEMVAKLRADYGNDLAYVDVNHYYYAVLTPNDPHFNQQYHLPLINAPAAWDVTTAAGITIAICDTGVLGSHPDLAAHITPGFNVAEGTSDTTDTNGHGTAVAGTAAAIGNNALDVAGVAFNATIMPVKIVISSDSFTDDFTIAAGIQYAADHGARIANLSFGSDSCDSPPMLDAGDYMRSRGGIVVQAAGNSGLNRGCPVTPQIVIVSATDSNDQVAGFSNIGNEIAVSAPGVGIVTTGCPSCLGTEVPNTEVESVDGTSFAAPVVSGVLALIFAINPSFSSDQARELLQSSSKDLGPPGFDPYYGWGRVDAAAAVGVAQQRSAQLQLQSLSNIYAYPNPWDTRKSPSKTVTIANVPDGATIKLFNIAGFWVKDLTASNGTATWDLTNSHGETVASGLYLYYVKFGDNTFRGKIAVIK